LYFLKREGNEIIPLDTSGALNLAIENSDDAFIFPPYSELLKYIAINGRTAFELLEDEKKLLHTFLSGINSFVVKSEKRAWYNIISNTTKNRA
jgi:hypothetical protein